MIVDDKERALEDVLEELEEESGERMEQAGEIPVSGEEDTESAEDTNRKESSYGEEQGVENEGVSFEEEGLSDSQTAEESQTSSGKEGFFSRKKDKKNPLQEKVEALNDKVMRQMAEFDNFRKRSEKEKSQMFDMGASSVLTKILPVIDNFERGFGMLQEEDKEDAFTDGMIKVYKQLMTELESIGVKPIEALGKEFDPNLHNAVMQVDTKEVESGHVAQELQKGYLYKDTVLRHSMVAVQQ